MSPSRKRPTQKTTPRVRVVKKTKRQTRADKENSTHKKAINAGMAKVHEKYPNLNIGDIMRFSVQGRQKQYMNPAERRKYERTKKMKGDVLRIFEDAANELLGDVKNKPKF